MTALKKTFLVEIGTEELPSRSLRDLAESFAMNFTSELDKVNLTHGEIKWFATPRRLAIKVLNVANFQCDHKIEKRGPTISKAFDKNGKPNKVAEKWAKNCGIDIKQAEYLINDKGKWLLYRGYVKGKSSEILLPNIVLASILKLPIQKLMRWGEGDICFIRPIHTVTLLLDNQIISKKILGIQSNRIIRGHRFMGKSQIIIDNADQYPDVLLEHGKVIADYKQRKIKIKINVEEAAKKIGGIADLDNSLLEEITSLVEWPVILIAEFKKKFLSVPSEALSYIIKKYQKCIPVYTENNNLLPYFIFVINIESTDQKKIVIDSEKVMHSRLVDAKFFFKKDQKKRLEDNLLGLKKVIFQKELGSLYDKTNRIRSLSKWISERIGANLNYTSRAALLSKCDLMTDMVCEFADIQGIMGMHYARFDGELEEVSISLKEQYYPRFSGDILPSSLISCSISISDKIDTIVGIFGINQFPKGDKDPFGLRRSALGVLRIIIEKQLDLDLKSLIERAICLYDNKLSNVNLVNNIIDFMMRRLLFWYQNKGYNIDIIQSVLSCRPTHPIDFDLRIKAISYFLSLKEATNLIKANKRIVHILKKSNEKLNKIIDTSILQEKVEIMLVNSLNILYDKINNLSSCYQHMLIEFSSLHHLIDEFFQKVIVNTENKELRINRLTLLSKFHKLFLKVADISLLQESDKT